MNDLTERERTILECMASGMSDKEIAVRCGIRIGTVRTHTRNVFRKLDVHNRVQAVVVWLDLIQPASASDEGRPAAPAGEPGTADAPPRSVSWRGWYDDDARDARGA